MITQENLDKMDNSELKHDLQVLSAEQSKRDLRARGWHTCSTLGCHGVAGHMGDCLRVEEMTTERVEAMRVEATGRLCASPLHGHSMLHNITEHPEQEKGQ